MPFEPYTNGIVSYSVISSDSRGAYRPTWELLYAHYVQIKGVQAPWTEEYRNYTVDAMGGFEGGAGSWGEGSGHYDGLGWGSLLYYLDDEDVAAAVNNSTSTAVVTSATSTAVVTPATSTAVVTPATSTAVVTSATSTAIVTPATSVPEIVSSAPKLFRGHRGFHKFPRPTMT